MRQAAIYWHKTAESIFCRWSGRRRLSFIGRFPIGAYQSGLQALARALRSAFSSPPRSAAKLRTGLRWNTSLGRLFPMYLVLCAASTWAQSNPCDLNQDGVVNVIDGQLAINMTLGLLACTANIEGAGVCNSDVVTRVMNAALGGPCLTGTGSGTSHAVSLSWIASTSANVTGYNVYRSTTPGGPYTKITPTPVSTTTFMDTAVQGGQIFYYVATAINSSNLESPYSTEVQAIVPTP